MFNPICKLNTAPIQFITTINTPPNIEFINNFNIFFIGRINILPKIIIPTIQHKKIIIVFSISLSSIFIE